MNCNEVNVILNLHAPEELDSGRRQRVERHLAGCDECRNAWLVFREIAATPIPDASRDLYLKVAAALPAGQDSAPRARRHRLFIGGAMLAAAAVAASIALRSGDDRIDTPPLDVPSAEAPDARSLAPPDPSGAAAPAAPAGPAGPAVAAAANQPSLSGAEPAASGEPTAAALDPMSVAVIVQSNADAAADALAALASCHEALLGLLSTLDGINVIAGDPVAAFEGTGLSPFEIARALGAGSVLTLELSGLTPSCNARMSDAASGARIFGATRFPDPGRIEPNEWDGFARGIAMSVNQAILMDEAQIARQAYEMVLNPALPDRQRASALSSLEPGRGTHPELIDSAILAAAIQLGTASADPSARESVWNSLRGLKDPELMQPLLFSLGYDDFADVRREAAMALHHFADEPEVRAALQQAIEQDPSQQREQPCCILSVREAAERALMSDAELRASIERTIMNAALPADSRIAPLRASPDGRVMAFPLNAALTRSVFEIGLASSAENRAFAWFLLSRGPVNPEFVPTLLDDLANHADILVRSNAASALGRYIDDPGVAAALERAAAEDTAERVQAVAGALLDRAEP